MAATGSGQQGRIIAGQKMVHVAQTVGCGLAAGYLALGAICLVLKTAHDFGCEAACSFDWIPSFFLIRNKDTGNMLICPAK